MFHLFLLGFISFLLLAESGVNAKVFTFTELNCRAEVPDTWVYTDTPSTLVSVVDIPHKRSFEIRTAPIIKTITLDNPEFLRGFNSASVSQGFTLKDSREVMLHGIRFHEISLTKDMGNKNLNVCLYITLADGYGYNLRIEAYDLDPDQDADLKAMVQSFTFIQPPHPHKAFAFGDIFNSHAGQPTISLITRLADIAIAGIGLLSFVLCLAVAVAFGVHVLENKDDDTEKNLSTSGPTPGLEAIHILLSNGQQGIYTESHVRTFLQNGTLTWETFYWIEGMPEWRPLKELSALQKTASSRGHEGELPYRFRFIHKVRFLRLAAIWIDLALIFVPATFVVIIRSCLPAPAPPETRPYFALYFIFGLYLIALIITQFVQVLRSRSVGKSLFRLRVINPETESKSGFLANVFRALTHGVFGVIPVALFFRLPAVAMAGVVFYAFLDAVIIFYNDRCIHDYLTGTTVIRRESSGSSSK